MKSFISKLVSAFTILLVSAMAYSSNMATMYVYICMDLVAKHIITLLTVKACKNVVSKL